MQNPAILCNRNAEKSSIVQDSHLCIPPMSRIDRYFHNDEIERFRGKPRTVEDEAVAELIIKTLSRKPKAALESARHRQRDRDCQGHRPSPVSALRSATSPYPQLQAFHRPLFVEKLRDVVGLYLNPPDRAVVLCVDEKSQIQALERTQPVLPKASPTITNPRDDHAVLRPQRA
jgi:hypothetical protein